MPLPFDFSAALLRDPSLANRLSLADWDLVIRQGRSAGLLARLADRLAESGYLDSAHESPQRHLRAALALARKHTRDVHWEVECVRRALIGTVDRIILLKGAAYVMAELPPGRSRIFNDIDILVPRESLGEVEIALQRGGWIAGRMHPYNARYYRRWLHQIPPMTHAARQTAIDVHHTLVPLTARVTLDPRLLLEATRPVPGQSEIHVLAPEDMVLHSAVHLLNEGEFDRGLRDLADLDLLLRHFSAEPGFWGRLTDRAEALDLARPLHYVLRHVARVFETPVPSGVAAQVGGWGPSRPQAAIMDSLFSRALRSPHAGCRDWFSGFALWLLYVRAHHLRMPAHLLVPHLLRKAYLKRFVDE